MLKRILGLSAIAAACLAFTPAPSEAQVRIGIGSGGYGGGRYYGGGYGGYGRNYGYGYGRPGVSIGIGNGYYGGYRGGYYGNGYYPGFYGSSIISAPAVPSYQSFYPPTTNGSFASSENSTASIAVRTPANAQLWWNGSPSTVSGELRYFRTAPLPAEGLKQTFQARWIGPDGQQVTQIREVTAMPNGNFNVDFNQPDTNAVPAIR